MGTPAYDRVVRVAMTALTKGHRVVDRLSGGRLGRRLVGAEVVWLTVDGRRSGTPQRVPLVTARRTDDGRRQFLVAGSSGGTEAPPAWALNLRGHIERGEHARLQVGDEHLDVVPRELTGAERDSGYAEMERAYRGFTEYQRQTSRVIPVFELTAES